MVSKAKRMKYVSDDVSSSDEISYSDEEFQPNDKPEKTKRRPTRRPQVFSRNALMARENRLKKKMYISNLENEVATLKNKNKKLSSVVSNQSFLITELEKEVKYLKSVLSNSGDISRLITNIHHSTGMSVTSSLDSKFSRVSVRKPKVPVARKTAHPWEENETFATFPTPELSNCDDLQSDLLLDDINLNLDLKTDEIFELLKEETVENNMFEEHNYTVPVKEESEDDVGVCLHVSKHRVSLEFCSSCSENAHSSWSS